MKVSHLPTKQELLEYGAFSSCRPMNILMSACLLGDPVLIDGSSFNELPIRDFMANQSNIKLFKFCPEDFSIGTPRGMPDIHGGNGHDVLDGKAKVLDEDGRNFTLEIINAAKKMLDICLQEKIDLAILTDMSASCGSQVISDGCRLIDDRKYQKGPGVCAALLIRNGIRVVSQRDYKTLELIFKMLDPSYEMDETKLDHHETQWYLNYFDETK